MRQAVCHLLYNIEKNYLTLFIRDTPMPDTEIPILNIPEIVLPYNCVSISRDARFRGNDVRKRIVFHKQAFWVVAGNDIRE